MGTPQFAEGEPPFEVPEHPLEAHFSPEEWEEFKSAVERAYQANDRALRRLHGSNRWRSPAFTFTRELRLHPKLADLEREEAGEHVDRALGEVFEQDKEEFMWSSLLGDSDTEGQPIDPYTDFLYCWDKCRPGDAGNLQLAVQSAQAQPPEGDRYGSRLSGLKHKPYRAFLRVIEELADFHPHGASIPLATEALAEAIGTSTNQVCRWRGLAERHGFLDKTSEASPGRAAEFRVELATED